MWILDKSDLTFKVFDEGSKVLIAYGIPNVHLRTWERIVVDANASFAFRDRAQSAQLNLPIEDDGNDRRYPGPD